MLPIGTVTTDARRRVVPPPPYVDMRTGVISVLLADDEEVEWLWYNNDVIGYTITRKPRVRIQTTDFGI